MKQVFYISLLASWAVFAALLHTDPAWSVKPFGASDEAQDDTSDTETNASERDKETAAFDMPMLSANAFDNLPLNSADDCSSGQCASSRCDTGDSLEMPAIGLYAPLLDAPKKTNPHQNKAFPKKVSLPAAKFIKTKAAKKTQ